MDDNFVELNNHHYTEALERAYLIGKILEKFSDHPVYNQTPELKKELERIQESVHNFYQMVGNFVPE